MDGKSKGERKRDTTAKGEVKPMCFKNGGKRPQAEESKWKVGGGKGKETDSPTCCSPLVFIISSTVGQWSLFWATWAILANDQTNGLQEPGFTAGWSAHRWHPRHAADVGSGAVLEVQTFHPGVMSQSQVVSVTTEPKCRTACAVRELAGVRKSWQTRSQKRSAGIVEEKQSFSDCLTLIDLGNSTAFAEIGKRPGLAWEWIWSLSCLWPQASPSICFQKDRPNVCSGANLQDYLS